MTAFGSIVAYSHREHLILVDLNRGEPMARFHRKAEASFAHSKRFAHHDVAVHVVASMFARATEPRSSVWSARSLLPLWRVGRQRCSLRGSIPATQSEMLLLPSLRKFLCALQPLKNFNYLTVFAAPPRGDVMVSDLRYALAAIA